MHRAFVNVHLAQSSTPTPLENDCSLEDVQRAGGVEDTRINPAEGEMVELRLLYQRWYLRDSLSLRDVEERLDRIGRL